MKLKTLQYFVQVAQEGSYSKAAIQCFVTQPALSRSISDLEEELGASLLESKDRQIVLTEAGKICFEEAKKIVWQCDEIKRKIHGLDTLVQSIKVGYIIYGHLNYFQNLLDEKNCLQKWEILTYYDTAVGLKEALKTDELDLVLLPIGCENSLKQIYCKRLTAHKMHIIVAKGHPLYYRDQVKFSDLNLEKMIGWDERDLPLVARSYQEAFIEKGVHPQVVAKGRKMGDLISLMKQHQAFGLATPVTTKFAEESIRQLEVEDSEENYGLCACWKKKTSNEALQELIRIL